MFFCYHFLILFQLLFIISWPHLSNLISLFPSFFASFSPLILSFISFSSGKAIFFYFNIFAFLLLFTSYIYFILFSVRSSSENIPVFHLISLFLCLFKINLMSFLDLRSLRSFVHSHLLSFLFLVIYILTFISLSFLSKEHADFK